MTVSATAIGRHALFGLALAAAVAAGFPARAQVPPEIAEINACLCLHQAYMALAADMNAKMQAFDAVNHQLADLDAQVQQQRPTVNINDPDAIAHFKALLERRDATDRQLPPAHDAADQAVMRYNARVNEYNARCIHPFNPALVAQVQTQLSCPPLQ